MKILAVVIMSIICLFIIVGTYMNVYNHYKVESQQLTIDSLNNVIAVKQRQQDSLTNELSLTNAKMLKAFVKQFKHTKKLGAEISGRRK